MFTDDSGRIIVYLPQWRLYRDTAKLVKTMAVLLAVVIISYYFYILNILVVRASRLQTVRITRRLQMMYLDVRKTWIIEMILIIAQYVILFSPYQFQQHMELRCLCHSTRNYIFIPTGNIRWFSMVPKWPSLSTNMNIQIVNTNNCYLFKNNAFIIWRWTATFLQF